MDLDAVIFVKGDGLMESSQDTGSFFIRKKAGKSEAGMVINSDVEGLDAGARITMRTIASGADAGLMKTAKLFNIKMKELAWSGAFVTEDRRLGRIERRQTIEAVPLKDAGKGSF